MCECVCGECVCVCVCVCVLVCHCLAIKSLPDQMWVGDSEVDQL